MTRLARKMLFRRVATVALAIATPASVFAASATASAADVGAPSSITMTSRGNGQLTVAWTAPSGSAIAYDVAYSSDGAQNWTRAATEISSTSLTISGPEGTTGNSLDDDATYIVAVRAQDTSSGDYSHWVNSGQFAPGASTVVAQAQSGNKSYNHQGYTGGSGATATAAEYQQQQQQQQGQGQQQQQGQQGQQQQGQQQQGQQGQQQQQQQQQPQNVACSTTGNYRVYPEPLTVAVTQNTLNNAKYDLKVTWNEFTDSGITYTATVRTDSDWAQVHDATSITTDAVQSTVSATFSARLDSASSKYLVDVYVKCNGSIVGEAIASNFYPCILMISNDNTYLSC